MKILVLLPIALGGCFYKGWESQEYSSARALQDYTLCKELTEVAAIDTYNYKVGVGSRYQSTDDCMQDKGYETSILPPI